MSYAEAIAYLQALTQFGMRPGLERMERLTALAGHPERALRFIHVAGTNGKGSTCAFLESIYREAGLRVGLYTSPHLVHFSERIQIDRVPISDIDLTEIVSRLRPLAEESGLGESPTFFEFATLVALEYFQRQKVDLVVWETGLGGRLDATNVVTPLACVITNIQFDHEKWLGHTLSEIAFEKAGIIKEEIPVLTASQEPEALEIIRRIAERKHAPLKALSNSELQAICPGDVPLMGQHQRLNAGLAVAAAHCLIDILPVTDKNILDGIHKIYWPGRMQRVHWGKDCELLLDGAHNLGGVEAFVQAIQALNRRPTALVVGMLADKALEAMATQLAGLALEVFTVPVQNSRTALAATLADFFRRTPSAPVVHECYSVTDALQKASNHGVIAVCGSLYLIGEVLALVGQSKADHGLNEWSKTGVGSTP